MNSILTTLITTLLFNSVQAQIMTYPECRISQWNYDETLSPGSCDIHFGMADLDNKPPNGNDKWEYLTSFSVPGDKGDTITPNLNFDITTGGDPNTVVKGTVYDFPMTTSNFTFGASAYLVVPKTGYYTFNIAATEGAIMNIGQKIEYYCCDSAAGQPTVDFYVANLQSEPENNKLEDSIYLLAGFRYAFAVLYLNSNGASPSLQLTMTDPDGVEHSDVAPFLYRITGISTDYCSYQNVTVTTTIEWQSSTTETVLSYVTSTNSAGSKVIESLYIVQVPTSSSQIESSSTVESQSSSTAISTSESITSSTVQPSSQIASNSGSSIVTSSKTTSSIPESSATSFSATDSSKLSSSESSTDALSSSPVFSSSSPVSSASLVSSSTNSVSKSVAEPSGESSESLWSSTRETVMSSNIISQSETDTSSLSNSYTAVVSNSEKVSSTKTSSPISSTDGLGSYQSSVLSSDNLDNSFTKITTASSDDNEYWDSNSNGNSASQTTKYITETSVITSTVTTLCSTETLLSGSYISSLEVFTSIYTSEFTTTVVFNSCSANSCEGNNRSTKPETTKKTEECTEDCVVTNTGSKKSSSKNDVINTKNSGSSTVSTITLSQKPAMLISSIESISGSITSHTVIQNTNMSSHATYDVLMFIFSMMMLLMI